MTVLSSTDLALELDYGFSKPDEILYRLEEGQWVEYRVNGKSVTHDSLELGKLLPGKYRFADR
jgi:hypothetical protein